MNHDRIKHSAMDKSDLDKADFNKADLDETDRQIQQALLSAPVPTSAKQRLLESLNSQQALQYAEEERMVVPQDAVQQDAVQQVADKQVVDRAEIRPVVSIAASAQVEETLTTTKAEPAPRSRKQTMAILVCLAASVLVMISLFVAAQPYSQDRLVAECTQRLEKQPESSWDQATLSSWTESLNLLRIAGIVRSPKQILHQTIEQSVIGSPVRLWKLEFENQSTLYAVELLDAPSVQGVQQHLQRLNQANQSWSMASIRTDKSVFVFFTKGNLDQLMQFSPLA